MDVTLAVEFAQVTKKFGMLAANSEVSFKVKKGTIHGIVGENGAGKSTAMKLLYGICFPDSGEIKIHGKKITWSSPSDAIRNKIGMVHQHFMLASSYGGLENILLGDEPVSPYFKFLPSSLQPIDKKKGLEKLNFLTKQYGLTIPWESKIEELPLGIQQRVEILKLLYRDADILILDEPTAVLTPKEVEIFFSNLKKLKEEGKTVLIITHKLKEVMECTDFITVFRAGKVTGHLTTCDTSPQELANLMVGRKVLLQVKVPDYKESRSAPLLEIHGLHLSVEGKEKLKGISFQIFPGEIVGIAGVDGNGQSELVRVLIDPQKSDAKTSGEITLLGKNIFELTSRQVKELGVSLVPEDRQKQGLLIDSNLRESFLLGLQRKNHFQKQGILSLKRLKQETERALREYDIRPGDSSVLTHQLSGGNQQKLVIAREFFQNPKLFIAFQPTRGVDVGAIEFIHKKMIQTRESGAGVLLVSSELEEILTLSDRILVLFQGKIVAQFKRGEGLESKIGLAMGGGLAS